MNLKPHSTPKSLYSVKDSFNKLTEIQDMALNPELNHGTPNFTALQKRLFIRVWVTTNVKAKSE